MRWTRTNYKKSLRHYNDKSAVINLHNWDIQFREGFLDAADIHLLELTITSVLFLVDNTSASSSNSSRGQRCRKDETGSIGPDHVD